REALNAAIVTRIDCTSMLQLDTPGDVLAWIRSAHATGSAHRRGRGVMKEGTLVFGDATGKNFARWQVVIYSKGQEIGAHPLPAMMMEDREVLEWTNRCLRVEVRLGRLELEKRGLRALAGWDVATAGMMWSEKVGSLTFNDAVKSETVDLEALPNHLRGTYAQWKLGADLRKLLSKPKFYRHRAAIMGLTGVDVAVPPADPSTASVVPIKRTLEARPVGRPDWANRIDRSLVEAGAFVLVHAA
ncbi:phage/plasmid replication protein, II/X family, partial [Novosphingobium sp. PY1]|uniref:phage/plasmid replication protein, II/X family n=1 Tax=Novosphingobium sp. PY1 TaxID=1882221 RepID=UPI001A8DCC22